MIEQMARSGILMLALASACQSNGSAAVQRTSMGEPSASNDEGKTPRVEAGASAVSDAAPGTSLPNTAGVLLNAQIVTTDVLGPIALGPGSTVLQLAPGELWNARQIDRFGQAAYSLQLPQVSLAGVLAGPDDTFFIYGNFSAQLVLGAQSAISTSNPMAQSGPADSYDAVERNAYSQDGFVARIDAAGKVRWLRTFAGAGEQSLTHALLSGDELLLVGSFEGRVNAGDIELGSRFGAASGASFVARANLDGEVTQMTAFDGTAERAAVCADGRIALSGRDVDPESSRVLRAMDADGAELWSESWPAYLINVDALGCDTEGRFYATVLADDTPLDVLVYGEHLSHEGALLRFDAEGEPTFLARIPGVRFALTLGLGADRVGLAGSFLDAVDFGDGAIASAGSTDVLLAEFDLEGELLWGTTWGGVESDAPMALYPTDEGWLLGFYTGTGTQLGAPAIDLPSGEHLMWLRATSAE